MNREWVLQHDGQEWHWYGCGQYAHAACGKPAIPGSPIVSAEKPALRVCSECSQHYDMYQLEKRSPH